MPSLPTMLKCVVPALEDHTSARGQELGMHDVQHPVIGTYALYACDC
jgi:hypothetical protein